MSTNFIQRLHAPGMDAIPLPVRHWLAIVQRRGVSGVALEADMHLLFINYAPSPLRCTADLPGCEQMRGDYEWPYQF